MIKYSFIIPAKEINDYIRESIPKILEIDRDDYEIIIYPNRVSDESWEKTKQIASGPGGPAMKRNLATRDALGEILIFIDDDAYPKNNFLDILDKDFKNKNIVAVGGPAVTPKDDTFWQKVSGAVFLSSLSGGCPERYVSIGKKRYIDDWPSVNLSVRKKDFELVEGFNSKYWPGEDTILCLDLIKKIQKKILYNPSLVVYHHRREGLLKHLRQVKGYGLHRGFFAKKFPGTSFKFRYFLPSFFLMFVFFGGIGSIFSYLILKLYIIGWIFYFIILVKSFFDIFKHEKNVSVVLNAIYYIFFTHLVYGLNFVKGFLFVRNLRSKLR